jgi:hypothetical protein
MVRKAPNQGRLAWAKLTIAFQPSASQIYAAKAIDVEQGMLELALARSGNVAKC